MKRSSSILTTFLVFAMTTDINVSVAYPQQNNPFNMADGFVFDGPIDERRPNSRPNFNQQRPPSNQFDPFQSNPIDRTEVATTAPTDGSTTTEDPVIAQCVQNCQVTAEYNPVCGTDNVAYNNEGRLNCARRCNRVVQLAHLGSCSSDIRG